MTRLKLGMVGGGQGAFIGAVHRIAARIDDHWQLVAGALSSEPDRAAASAAELGLPADRSYANFDDMARAEAGRADGIDAVSIVTPNHMHAAPAIAFLNAGIHVICEKPLASTMKEAEAIAMAVRDSGCLLVLTHNYTGYPLIRQTREMVSNGDLGEIRLVHVEYAQDWLTEATEDKQANWRTDPARSGPGGCICVFRGIRPPIPTTSGHLNRGIRPPVARCVEANSSFIPRIFLTAAHASRAALGDSA